MRTKARFHVVGVGKNLQAGPAIISMSHTEQSRNPLHTSFVSVYFSTILPGKRGETEYNFEGSPRYSHTKHNGWRR